MDMQSAVGPEGTLPVTAKDASLREIGDQAVWSLSSAKNGFGIAPLRDDNVETYWQSDGTQPHLVNIQFYKKMAIREVMFYIDYKADESYTPSQISIRAGSNFHDLREVELADFTEPDGWVSVPLGVKKDTGEEGSPLSANFLQIAILANHQNGRDCHLRQIKVFGPRPAAAGVRGGEGLPDFTSPEILMYGAIR